ncbi:MAG: DNA polymerase III subunit gamma/tau, partial [Desulfitobacteriaceae bacterium]
LVKTIYDGEEQTGEAWPESADAKAVGASRGSYGEGKSADSQAGRRDQTSEALGKSPRVQAEGQSPKSRAGGNTSDIKSVTLAQIEGRWQEILERVRQQKKSTHAFLLEGKPEILEGEVLTLVFKDGFSFHRDKVNQPENRLTIEKALLDLFGVSLTLKNVLENEVASADKTQESEEEILIKKAEAIFGKDFVEVRQD